MMISVQEAEAIILDLVKPLTETEILPLEAVQGRILGQSVTSKLDFPYWDNSAMDGYAVRFDDVKNANTKNPVILEVVSEIPAGIAPQTVIESGKAARIFTGAMLPEGADTVIMQENTQREGQQVKILIAPDAPQHFVRQKGAYYQAGNSLLPVGIKLNSPEIAVLATAQCVQVTVYRQPKVAIFSTGNELISPKTTLKPGQIIDSNQYALSAFIESQGAIPTQLGILPDEPDILRETIKKAINQGDFVLSTGGVSVGDYDYIETLLGELGADIQIRSVAIKPGKPLTVAKFPNGCLYFGIPGNPVSALVTAWRFVQPALKKGSGLAADYTPHWISAELQHPLTSGGQRETYIWGNLHIIAGKCQFSGAKGSQNSANLINLAQTNALAVIPIGVTFLEVGTLIKVMVMTS